MEDLFKDFGKVIIRSPFYSYVDLFDQNNETRDLEDLVCLRLKDPVFLEALYWSSPQLYNAALKFKEGSVKGPKENKLMQTLKKYFIRASTRCTPYGIYASTGIATPGSHGVDQKREMERKVRIDMGLLQNIKSHIESDPGIYPYLLYSINNSLYSIPGQYRFTETIIENGKCHYQLSALHHTVLLEQIVELAKDRMISPDDIYELTEEDTSYEEFNDFIKELITSQFLVSELQLGLTTGDELGRFAEVLNRLKEKGINAAKKYLDLFLFIENILIQFKKLPLGVLPLEEIKDLKSLLAECGIGDFQDHIFQADLKESFKEHIVFPGESIKDIKKGILILGKLTNNDSNVKQLKNQFIKLFGEKYDTREISLSEVLDPEFGIGFPPREKIGDTFFNSLIQKVDLATDGKIESVTRDFQAELQDKTDALNIQFVKEDIQLRDEDLKDLNDKYSTLPNTLSVMGRLLPSGKILLESVGGAHSNALLGRFAYLDNKIEELCKQLVDTDQQNSTDVIFAEIIFIPEGRIGNIARRPILSRYEIPILACPGVDGEKRIPINDILVSIHDNEIILRSKKLNKRIIPRLSNAHNYSSSEVPVYKFLASIQSQGTLGLKINWGDFAAKKRFLPRITYKNIILHRACWFLYKSDIKTIIESPNSIEQLRRYLQKWNVSKFVCFTEGDNELFIDTSNNSYLEILIEEIKSLDSVKLNEWLYTSPSGNFESGMPPIQQFILPLFKKDTIISKPLQKLATLNEVQRTFEPGTEWIYFKIYCGSTFSDEILSSVVNPAIQSLLKSKVIRKAFFIRYTDPHYHIRFRLQLVNNINKQYFAMAIKCIYSLLHPFSANRIIWNVQLDTYQREIERYGERGILTSEVIFFHDSLLYLNCLKHEEFIEDEQIRFLVAIKNIDKWLTLIKMSLKEKADYCLQNCQRFSTEFDSGVKFQLDLKYRELKNGLPSFLNSDDYDKEFNERDRNLQKILMPKENLTSYIHMSMNRWFLTEQRLMEYMCYLFCNKYYNQLLWHNQKEITKVDLEV
ncbi:MAG TPA: lantibiotic dehydratase [Hanamia sp.]